MAKQGQHKRDDNDPRVSKGPNNPDKSVTITTGSYKKEETTREQAARHQDTERQGQADNNDWQPDTRDPKQEVAPDERRASADSNRDGSDSNASSGTRGH